VAGESRAIVILWSFLHLTSVPLRIYGKMVTTAVLPLTPVILINSARVLLSAYAAYMGVEVTDRPADLLFPCSCWGLPPLCWPRRESGGGRTWNRCSDGG